MRGRMALWAVLVAIIVAVAAIIVVGGGGDDSTTLAKLPISLGSGEGGRDAAMSADAMFAPVTYVLDDGAPGMGGEADAYRLTGELTDQTVAELAKALAVAGSVQRDGDRAFVEDGDRILEVYDVAGLPWNMYDMKGTVSSGVAVACSSDMKVCPEPPQPERPADLPSEDEARDIALALLDAAGTDTNGAHITVDDAFTAWGVAVDPLIDGTPTWGATSYITVGSQGAIQSANGWLGKPQPLGAYPRIDTQAAVDRLNSNGGWFGGGPVAMAESESFSSAGAPVEGSGGGSSGSTGSAGSTEPGVSGGGTGGCTPEECGYTCKTQPDGSEICEAPGEPPMPATTVPCEGGPGDDCAAPPPVDCLAGADTPTTDEEKLAQQTDPSSGGFCPYPCDVPLTDEQPTTTTAIAGSEAPAIAVAPCGPYPCITDDPAEPGVATDLAPICEPYPEPEPVTIVLTDVQPVLLFIGGWDGGDAYLVPGYLFSAEDGSTVAVPAIPDDLIEQPRVKIQPEPLPLPGETEPMPAPAEGKGAEIGVGYYVDVVLHCGTVTFDGSSWITDTDVSGWNDGTEGGTFTLTSPDEAEFVGDANRDKVASFKRQPGDPVACE